MSRREKVLLQILVAVGVVGVLAVYLLLPAVKKSRTLKSQNQELVLLQDDMEVLLTTPGLADSMEQSKQSTEETRLFFNKDFATYSVDSIVNGLVDKNNLKISSLRVDPYRQRYESEIGIVWETEVESEDEEFIDYQEGPTGYLLGADVTMSVEGYYEDILNFIDSLNGTSKCIDINGCTYSRVENYNPYETAEEEELHKDEEVNYVMASINMTIYSMKPYEGGE